MDLELTRDSLTIRGHDREALPISLCVADKIYQFVSGTTRVFALSDAVTKEALLETD